jgi:hypothetical protein
VASRRTRIRDRRRRSVVVALACGLLQLATGLEALAFSDFLSSDHAHETIKVIDGNHIDVVHSHDPVRHVDADELEAHLHGARNDDHVVHLVADEDSLSPRVASPDLPAELGRVSPVRELFLVARPARPCPQRAAPPFARRSVVRRT